MQGRVAAHEVARHACRESAVIPRSTVAIGMIGFCLVDSVKWPAPLVVVLGGALGLLGGILNFP